MAEVICPAPAYAILLTKPLAVKALVLGPYSDLNH